MFQLSIQQNVCSCGLTFNKAQYTSARCGTISPDGACHSSHLHNLMPAHTTWLYLHARRQWHQQDCQSAVQADIQSKKKQQMQEQHATPTSSTAAPPEASQPAQPAGPSSTPYQQANTSCCCCHHGCTSQQGQQLAPALSCCLDHQQLPSL